MNAVDDYDLKTALLSGTGTSSYAVSHGFSPHTIRRHALLLVSKGYVPLYMLVPPDDITTIFAYLPKTKWDGTLRGLFSVFQQRFSMSELDMIYHSAEFSEFIKEQEKNQELQWNMEYIRKRMRAIQERSRRCPLQKPGHYMYIAYGKDDEGEEKPFYIEATSALGSVIENPPAGVRRLWVLHTETLAQAVALAEHFTKGLSPKYPTHMVKKDPVYSIDMSVMEPTTLQVGEPNRRLAQQ